MLNSPCGLNHRQRHAALIKPHVPLQWQWQAVSVHADGLELIAPCVGDRSLPAIGQHDRGAVGGMQREQFQARRDPRRLGEKPGHVLGTDLLHLGDMAFAKMGQRLLGDPFGFERHTHVTHGLDSSI